MKSNVIMVSPDRELFGVKIKQETKTEFLNLSDLQEAYTKARVINGWSNKGHFQDIIAQKENIERIYCLLDELKIINSDFSEFIKRCENSSLLKVLKEVGVYKTTGARSNKTVWAHPAIWVMVALELNPRLYAKVSIWLGDKLILNRIEAGNFYKSLSKALGVFKLNGEHIDYIRLAKSLNYKIFGRHETGIRNLATKEQLQKLYELESNIAFSIDMGFISTFEDAITIINK